MINFPIDCDTPRRRTEYCYRAEELLRRLHNHMGWWYRGFDFLRDAEGRLVRDPDGKVILDLNAPWTQTQYNHLPQKLKNRYPYQTQLPQAEWDDFRRNVFEPISQRIAEKLLENREFLFQSTNWTINVEDI